jgi:hypothetical protein
MTVERIPHRPDVPFGLGRHVNHDPASLAYAYERGLSAPKKSLWQRAPGVPMLDQGQIGSCTGNAATNWLATTNALRAGLDRLGSIPVNEALALELYHQATVIDPYKGTYPPDDTGSDGLSVVKALKKNHAVASYRHAFTLRNALLALEETPVLFGTVWLNDMFNPGPGAILAVSGEVAGGHEYLGVGYDPATDLIRCANSWGEGWGDGGYFHVHATDMAKLLKRQGDVTIPHALIA